MAPLVRQIRYLGILLLSLGMFSLSHIIAPDLGRDNRQDVWIVRGRTHLPQRTELFRPGCMYMGPPTLRGLVERIGNANTFTAIGEVARMHSFHDKDERSGYSIAYFRTLRPLTPNGRDVLQMYTPFGKWKTKGNMYGATGVAGYDCTRGLAEGDRILVVLQRGQAKDWGMWLDPKLGEVWRALALWHLKGSPDDEDQCLYQLGDWRDALSLRGLPSDPRRIFVTDERTLRDGIESVRVAYEPRAKTHDD
jgi:hypothetical protein